MSKYKILFSENDKNDYTFKSLKDFIEWSFSNKDVLSEGEFEFESEMPFVSVSKAKDVLAFLKYYIKIKKACNQKMEYYNNELLNMDLNEELKQAASEFVRLNDNGKFLRATLVALGYNSAFQTDDYYLNLAMAVEIFQTSILIHDDIIDNADIRRGMKTIPVSYNDYFSSSDNSKYFLDKRQNVANSLAICIGDFGFYYANELIVRGYRKSPYLADVLSYYHQTAIKTCKGEIVDVVLPFKEEFFETDEKLEEKIMEVYKLKTAWYSVIGPYCLGLILGGASMEKVQKFENILMNVGIAFQIKDDLLGIYGNEKVLGKSTNSDIEEYKQTILYSYVINTDYKEELLKYYGKNDLSIDDVNRVKEIFEVSGARKYAEDMMNSLFEQSFDELSLDFDTDKINVLKGFIVYLENRSK